MSQHTRPKALIVAGFGVGQIAAFASSFYLMGVLGDPIGRELHLSPLIVFGLVSLSLAVPAFVAPAVARRIDETGGAGVLLTSHLVFALGLVLLGRAEDAAGLAAAMLTMGLGMAYGLSPTPFAILVALYGEAARRPITAVALVGGLGSTVGWPLTGWLAEELGWRGACFAWAVVHVALFPLTAWVCPEVPGRHARKAEPHAPIVWDRAMVQLAVLFACAWFVSTCMSAHLPRLLAHFGLSMPQAAAAAGLVGLAASSVRLLEFTLLRRLPPLATTRVATLTHPAGAVALAALGGGTGAQLMAIGQGAGNGMLTVAKGVLPLSLWGPGNYAYRSALLGRPAMLAQVAGPAAYAVVLERSPILALALTSGLCLVMFAMTFGLARRGETAQEPVLA